MEILAAAFDLGSGLGWLYLSVFLLVAADAVVPLVPGETALIAAGVLAAGGGSVELGTARPSLVLVCLAAAAGAWLGDNLAYLIGWRAGPYAVVRLLGRNRGPRTFLQASRALSRHGIAVLLAARFVPGARTLTSLGAGVVGYPVARFRLVVAVAGLCWAVFVGLLGYLGGRIFQDNLLAGVVAGMAAALAMTVVIEGVRWLWRRRQSASAADHQLVKQLLAGPGDRVDGGLEGGGVVRGRCAEAGDLSNVLERGSAHVVRGDLVGERWAQGLDAAAHATQSGPGSR